MVRRELTGLQSRPPAVDIHRELVRFHGHPEVRATHRNTIEFTRNDLLTPRGDCIVGVRAERALAGLSEEFKQALRATVRITFIIEIDGASFSFRAMGDPRLKLASPTDMVIRKSDYICERTLAIKSEAAAIDIPRAMITLLRNGDAEGKLRMEVEN